VVGKNLLSMIITFDVILHFFSWSMIHECSIRCSMRTSCCSCSLFLSFLSFILFCSFVLSISLFKLFNNIRILWSRSLHPYVIIDLIHCESKIWIKSPHSFHKVSEICGKEIITSWLSSAVSFPEFISVTHH